MRRSVPSTSITRSSPSCHAPVSVRPAEEKRQIFAMVSRGALRRSFAFTMATSLDSWLRKMRYFAAAYASKFG